MDFEEKIRSELLCSDSMWESANKIVESVIALEKRVKELENPKAVEPEKIRVLPFVMYDDVMANHKDEYEFQLGSRCTLPGKDGPVLLPSYELASLKAAIISEIGQRIGYGRDADGWYKTEVKNV